MCVFVLPTYGRVDRWGGWIFSSGVPPQTIWVSNIPQTCAFVGAFARLSLPH